MIKLKKLHYAIKIIKRIPGVNDTYLNNYMDLYLSWLIFPYNSLTKIYFLKTFYNLGNFSASTIFLITLVSLQNFIPFVHMVEQLRVKIDLQRICYGISGLSHHTH